MNYDVLKDYVIFVKEIISIIGILMGLILAIRYYFSFSPKVNLKISKVSFNLEKELVLITFELENTSKIIAKVKEIRINVKEYKYTPKEVPKTEHVEFDNKSEIICKATKTMYPGEKIIVDRIINLNKDNLLQIGLQLKTQGNIFCKSESRTTTSIIIPS